jgi:hypothetical protein
MEPPPGRRVLPALPVAHVRKVAADRGVPSLGVIGNERLIEFRADGFTKTLLMRIDMETFSPNDVLRLIDFFPSRLSKQDFWPELAGRSVISSRP